MDPIAQEFDPIAQEFEDENTRESSHLDSVQATLVGFLGRALLEALTDDCTPAIQGD